MPHVPRNENEGRLRYDQLPRRDVSYGQDTLSLPGEIPDDKFAAVTSFVVVHPISFSSGQFTAWTGMMTDIALPAGGEHCMCVEILGSLPSRFLFFLLTWPTKES